MPVSEAGVLLLWLQDLRLVQFEAGKDTIACGSCSQWQADHTQGPAFMPTTRAQ